MGTPLLSLKRALTMADVPNKPQFSINVLMYDAHAHLDRLY